MKRIGIGLSIVVTCAVMGMGQDLFETGELIIDVNYDDFDASALNATGLSDPFVFNDIPGNETGALEFEIPAGLKMYGMNSCRPVSTGPKTARI